VVLAGLVAGTMTASTAFRPEPVADGSSATLAAAPPQAALEIVPIADVVAPPVGALRVQESAIAEWEYRKNLPPPVSRSTNTPGSLVRPANGARTGWFGEGRRSHRHAGIDFDGNTGDPVVSAGSGVVTHAGGAPAGYSGYGQMVLVDHGGGVTTLYAHLSRLFVRVGQTVAPAERIGSIGTTGNVTGSHLHFEVRVGGRPVNPANWIAG
jgi:murein DD-endopeptidase MepM/ murein hydrolase activator NlpD